MGTRFGKFGTLLVAGMLVFLMSCSSESGSSTSSASALFVAIQGDQLVRPYVVNPSNGRISPNGSPLFTGVRPTSMVLAPSGDVLFISNRDSKTITIYTVNSDGTLTAAGVQDVQSDPLRLPVDPVALAINPAGTLLFIVNQGDLDLTSPDSIPGSVSVFAISGTSLTELAASPFLTEACSPPGVPCTLGNGPVSAAVAVVGSGSYLYTANQFDGTVGAFTIDGTGDLAPLPGAPYAAGTAPSAIAVGVGGSFVYVANAGSNDISAFTLCGVITTTCSVADGSLVPFPDTFPAGVGPVAIAVAPSGNFLYAADFQSNQVSQYRISTVTGALTPNSPAAISSGQNPIWISIPAGGAYVYVANIGASSIVTFRINTVSGNLGLDGPPIITGGQPSAIAVK
jgi:6-phosphogluconolactonase